MGRERELDQLRQSLGDFDAQKTRAILVAG
jgi:hypothetical protein